MERDEVYVPKTRADLGILDEGSGKIDYDEIFGDTPLYTLFMLVRQQLLAFPTYLRRYLFGLDHPTTNLLQFTTYRDRKVILKEQTTSIVSMGCNQLRKKMI